MRQGQERAARWFRALRDHPEIPAALVLLIVASVFGLLELDSRLNVDGAARWYRRTVKFWNAVFDERWRGTFQSHPGVTYMWLAGLAANWAGLLGARWSPELVVVLKLPVALLHVSAVMATFFGIRRYLGAERIGLAFAVAFLWATEPFALGHARSLHLDSMVADLSWLAVLAALLSMKERDLRWALASGVLLGFAVLTKIAAASIAVGIAVAYAIHFVRTREGRALASTTIIAVVALATTFLAWPALLFAPGATIRRLVDGAAFEVGRGHLAFFAGERHLDPGLAFYPAVLFFRSTPETQILVVACVAFLGWAVFRMRKVRLAPELALCLWLGLIYVLLAVAWGGRQRSKTAISCRCSPCYALSRPRVGLVCGGSCRRTRGSFAIAGPSG